MKKEYFNNGNEMFVNIINYESNEYNEFLSTENVHDEELDEIECSYGFSPEHDEVEDNVLAK